MIYIGIDTGVNTGFAVWDSEKAHYLAVQTVKIHKAMKMVHDLRQERGKEGVLVRIEDARKRTWFGNAGRGKLQGAGSIKRDCGIWEDFLEDEGVRYELIAPKDNMTKLDAQVFKRITGWAGRTSYHGRDAAMLVFGVRSYNSKRYGKTQG